MKEDNIKLRRVLAADVQFLKEHGIMDYSLLLSAERYSANTVKQDDGSVIDPETPKAKQGPLLEQNGFMSINGPAPKRRMSRQRSFFERCNSGVLQSKDALNDYLRQHGVHEG